MPTELLRRNTYSGPAMNGQMSELWRWERGAAKGTVLILGSDAPRWTGDEDLDDDDRQEILSSLDSMFD